MARSPGLLAAIVRTLPKPGMPAKTAMWLWVLARPGMVEQRQIREEIAEKSLGRR